MTCVYDGSMELDPIPEDVRQFLMKNFTDVRDEPPQGDYYVFSLKTSSGPLRHLKVHRSVFIYSEMVSDYLRNEDLAGQLERGDVEIAEPLSSEWS
jgi:hypothetical protein